jgi:hypothetical protein
MKLDPQGILHPEGYHGQNATAPYFEGWYFKIVDASEGARYAIIPGISLSPGDGGPHSFVQVLDGATGQTLYQRYSTEAFAARRDRLEVHVGPNHFTASGMSLNIATTSLTLQGDVQIHGLRPWPVRILSPGIMGWYGWVPRMECYHGVLSFDHTLGGGLQTADQYVDFSGGRGYIEKDWGQSFPSAWVWTQTNHFGTPGISLTASIAMIPWIGHAFPGFIVGFHYQGTLVRFATYTGARTTRLQVTDDVVDWTMEDAVYRLRLIGHRAESGALRGPSKVDMGRPVPETLSATIDTTLTSRLTGETLFHGIGRHAGMEVGGDIARLIDAVKPRSRQS